MENSRTMSRKPILIALTPSPVSVYAPSSSSSVCSNSSSSSNIGDMDELLVVRRGKKRRLDHLSMEEKVQRKKLKNRVAAQTSRDRKKMKMDEMEEGLARLDEENVELKNSFRTLETENQKLRRQNETLHQQLEELRQKMEKQEERLAEQEEQLKRHQEEKTQWLASSPVASASADIALKIGSAASTDVDPQQQGLSANSSSSSSKTTTTSSVWQVIALCLLYRICSKQQQQPQKETADNAKQQQQLETCLTCLPGRNWPKLYSQISPGKWQAMLREAVTKLPRMQAPYHGCLDSWWGPEQSAWNPPAKVEA